MFKKSVIINAIDKELARQAELQEAYDKELKKATEKTDTKQAAIRGKLSDILRDVQKIIDNGEDIPPYILKYISMDTYSRETIFDRLTFEWRDQNISNLMAMYVWDTKHKTRPGFATEISGIKKLIEMLDVEDDATVSRTLLRDLGVKVTFIAALIKMSDE